MGMSNGGVITDLPSSAGGRSQHEQARQTSRRPPRACTARTPSRLAPAAPAVERTPSRKQHGRSNPSRSDPDPPFTPMVLNSPPPPAQHDRWLLRSMWQLASIINFLNVFRPVLKINVEFSIEELESALLSPNGLLDSIHIALLKAIPPISRNPLTGETWVAALCKKMKDRWHWVAEDTFPLALYHGDEAVTYRELDPYARVVILKALCEARLEQDDIRVFIDEMLKQGAPLSNIRKERTGCDTQGTTYWYENDLVAGQRLYRELRRSDSKDKPKVRGQLVPPPTASSHWETLATNLDEFLVVADKLGSSRNRMEVAIGKRINNDIVPELQHLQKKKEHALKKQQRQALLLDSYLNIEGLNAGRPKRERKPVTYTFDDFDKSISEAIKITTRRNVSPEILAAVDKRMPNGNARQQSDDDQMDENSFDSDKGMSESAGLTKHDKTTRPPSKVNNEEATHSSGSESSGPRQFGRGKRLRKPQKYAENDFVDSMSDNEGDGLSEDDIEGEAVYDDDYVSTRKRRLDNSSDGDDEYRGDEDDEEEEEDDFDDDDDDDDGEDDYVASSDDGESRRSRRHSKNAGKSRTRAKAKAPERSHAGLRRSQRATRSHVNYRKYEESDNEADEDTTEAFVPERADYERVAMSANGGEDSSEDDGGREPAHAPSQPIWEQSGRPIEGAFNTKELHVGDGVHSRPANGVNYEPLTDAKPEIKRHRFLDLNVAVPMAGGGDETVPSGCGKGFNQSLPFMVDKLENSGDDGSACDSPETSKDRPRT